MVRVGFFLRGEVVESSAHLVTKRFFFTSRRLAIAIEHRGAAGLLPFTHTVPTFSWLAKPGGAPYRNSEKDRALSCANETSSMLCLAACHNA